ncbi:MAG TPA: hypothetical protein GXX57_02950 [Firmicutes bacterium]|nr:hypothetical protein [Bacillota bacterium]
MKLDKQQSRLLMFQQAMKAIQEDPNQDGRFKERGLRVLEQAYKRALRELEMQTG